MNDNEETRVTNAVTGGQKGSKEARFDLIPARPLELLARLYGKGAKKYEPWNWMRGYDWSLSRAALGRHLNAYDQGEDLDPETRLPPLVAVIFHAMALIQFAETHPELDDRPTTISPATSNRSMKSTPCIDDGEWKTIGHISTGGVNGPNFEPFHPKPAVQVWHDEITSWTARLMKKLTAPVEARPGYNGIWGVGDTVTFEHVGQSGGLVRLLGGGWDLHVGSRLWRPADHEWDDKMVTCLVKGRLPNFVATRTLAQKRPWRGSGTWEAGDTLYVSFFDRPPEAVKFDGTTWRGAEGQLRWAVYSLLYSTNGSVKSLIDGQVSGFEVVEMRFEDGTHHFPEQIADATPASEVDSHCAMG